MDGRREGGRQGVACTDGSTISVRRGDHNGVLASHIKSHIVRVVSKCLR
jgi:hypothetical protein